MEDKAQNTWPQSYYREQDAKLRKFLLDEEMKEHPGSREDELRLKLWEIRYVPNDKKASGQQVDNYIGGWMEMLYLSRNNGGLFGFRYAAKELKKTIKKMGFGLAKDYEETGENILYQEIYHLCSFYYHLCATDKGYGTKLMGIMSLKDEDITAKIAKEVAQNAYRLPMNTGLSEEMKVFTKAATQAFYDTFPGEREKLDYEVEKLRK